MSASALAKKYSVDASAVRGGAYGCFAPNSSSYASVRNDIGTAAVGHFPTTALSYSPTAGGATYGLFVAATSKTPTTLAMAQGAVINDIQTQNAATGNTVKSNILYAAAVSVDPAFGRWGLSTSGPSVFAPALPTETGPATTTQLTTASTTPYQ